MDVQVRCCRERWMDAVRERMECWWGFAVYYTLKECRAADCIDVPFLLCAQRL